jgi:hypothetical protein
MKSVLDVRQILRLLHLRSAVLRIFAIQPDVMLGVCELTVKAVRKAILHCCSRNI